IARPDVDEVSGISPSIAIQQKNTTRSSRSTVGTTTEIYDYLRLLFARVGKTYCPDCECEVIRHEPEEVVEQVIREYKGQTWLIIARVDMNNNVDALVERLVKNGYTRVLVKNDVRKLDEISRGALARRKSLRVVLDRVVAEPAQRTRMSESVEGAYRLSDGFVEFRSEADGQELSFTRHLVCASCERRFEEPRPILFSFNTPYGACPQCRGFGNRMEFDEKLIVPDPSRSIKQRAIEPWASGKFEYFFEELIRFCRRRRISVAKPFSKLTKTQRREILGGRGDFVGVIPFLEEIREKSYKKYARFFTRRYLTFRECRYCGGGRLRSEAYFVRLQGKTIRDISSMVPAEALAFIESLRLSKREEVIARDVLLELRSRLKFLLDVGLYYLTLDRLTKTLSGGESQRINLANSLGANLIGVLYVLDEPSVGLHPTDTGNLIKVLIELRNRGNTVVVVEHDLDIIEKADNLIDLGPGAGRYGGEVLYQGTLREASHPRSKTIKYLREGLPVESSDYRRSLKRAHITLEGVSEHNLKNIDVSFPFEAFTVVTGVSGSGKSTLVCDVLYDALRNPQARRGYSYRRIHGATSVDKAMLVDQSPIGRTPRSNPITYIKAFSYIRDIFAAHKLSRKRGYTSGRFSFNVPGGRCGRCEGMGYERIEMHFMADIFVRCSDCDGRRFNADTREVTYHGKDVADVLDLTVDEAITFFADHRGLVERLITLKNVGLGYLQLGQPATTLSGGESQRTKIARELSENVGGGAVYILDEPTTGLHIDDVDVLVKVLRSLVHNGNTVIVVEHNIQVISQADHIIDLGPGGGEDGGHVVATGSPSQIMRARRSQTGAYLKKCLRSTRKGVA
ncbi:MAG: excinuclease ABC subunit UvrA, partial [Candidatus Krumholzibacteria bacterium]|nr:excinuclease ABC subunit UvrA [Candidatus Krumholzibacteria bacterium]